jgi:hypothetical protein
MLRPALSLISGFLLLGLAGCGVQDTVDEPGVRGPVVFRIWDRAARASDAPPTVVRADAVRQTSSGFDDLEMLPVLIRRPVSDGVLWVHAPSGTFKAAAKAADGDRAQEIALAGPVHFTGILGGIPVSGCASDAAVPRGGSHLELHDIQFVRGGSLLTAPRAELVEGAIRADGPVRIGPGAPALTAALAALPSR